MHPSLECEFIAPPSLEPKRVMPVNAPCWCDSGKKWKKCHKDRESQKPEPIGSLMVRQHLEMIKGYCLHPEASNGNCSEQIISAHTVQRRGGLAAIAENGHVISPKKGFEDIFKNDGEIIPRQLGIRDASTFMGFCSFHDNQMFSPIEKNPLCLGREAAFLLSFRATSYEYFMKDAALRANEILRELDKGKPFEIQCYIQQHLHLLREGMKRGMGNLEKWKHRYDQAYLTRDYSGFASYSVRFSGLLPIVASGAFFPEYDLNGNRLQIISRGTAASSEHVCFNLTSIDGKSILVLGWTGESKGPAEIFFNSFRGLNNQRKANAAFYLAIEHLENIYLQPSWWESQPDSIKKELIQRIRSGIGITGTERTPQSLSNFRYVLSELVVEEELTT